MSKVLQLKLKGCENFYTAESLYDSFGIDEKETAVCMSCPNHVMEDGILTCKYMKEMPKR